MIRQNSLTTARPTHERQEGSSYCAVNKCYTPTEFALFGVGAIIMGCMVGVVGISWFKNHFLPDEKQVNSSNCSHLSITYHVVRSCGVWITTRWSGTTPRSWRVTTTATQTWGQGPGTGRR